MGRSRDGGIDRVAIDDVPGDLWLCGKHAIAPDPDDVVRRLDLSTVVCLTERHELADRYPDYLHWLLDHEGRGSWWFPIPDLHAPTPSMAAALAHRVAADLREGHSVLLHCAAGIGRAGTMACCVLMALGQPVGAARALVAESRPMAGPEAGAQEALLASIGVELAR